MKGNLYSILAVSLLSLALLVGVTSAQPPVITHCPVGEYDMIAAVESFESLLYGQEQNIMDFEELLHQYGDQLNGSQNATYLVSFEDLLVRQTDLHEDFSELLGNETNWNFTDPDDQTMFLASFGELLMREKDLYASFYSLLNDTWCDQDFKNASVPCGIVAQAEFLWSFEDLLHRQASLIRDYNNLTKNLDPEVPINDTIDAINTSEGLIRYHSVLLEDFEDLLENPCTNLSSNVTPTGALEVSKTLVWAYDWQEGIYTITVKNTGTIDATGVTLNDTYPVANGTTALLEIYAPPPGWVDHTAYGLFTIGNLPAGNTAQVFLTLEFPKSMELGPFNNSICVTSDQGFDSCSYSNDTRTNLPVLAPRPSTAQGTKSSKVVNIK